MKLIIVLRNLSECSKNEQHYRCERYQLLTRTSEMYSLPGRCRPVISLERDSFITKHGPDEEAFYEPSLSINIIAVVGLYL
jgi:hypothetical protein